MSRPKPPKKTFWAVRKCPLIELESLLNGWSDQGFTPHKIDQIQDEQMFVVVFRKSTLIDELSENDL